MLNEYFTTEKIILFFCNSLKELRLEGVLF